MKTKKRSFIIQVLFAALVSVFTLGLVSCAPEQETTNYGETGVYYFDADTEEYLLTLSSGNSVSMYIDGEDVFGTYSYDGTNLAFNFDGEETIEAELKDNVITMEYDDASYRFLKKIKYAVNYELDGGVGVESSSVTNGKTLAKPADPTKEGYKFVGWYEDADFTTPFSFGATPILSNITLYARFISAEIGQSEYTVTFVDGETVIGSMETVGGEVFDISRFTPEKEGETFLGWWMSDYEDATKLTAKYTNQAFDENTTLYAVWKSAKPTVSVSASSIEWSAEGITNVYKMEVKNANGTVVASHESSAMSYAYNFAAQPAGDYEITVTINGGESTTAYYKNKALARVSHFYVSEPSMLIFEGVENAEKYLVTMVCGSEGHEHVAVDNGTSTNYPFANCDMKEGGIEFTVQAVASGYATSTSAVFYYEKNLESVSGVKLNADGDKVVWNSVKNATSYAVSVNGGEAFTVKSTSVSVKGYAGDVTVAITPVAKGYNSPVATEFSYVNERLATPTGIAITYDTITWGRVENAVGYVITFGGKIISIEGNENRYQLVEEDFDVDATEYAISVQAIAENEAQNSFVSDVFVAPVNTIGAMSYNAGVLSWTPVIGAYRFGISVNGSAYEKTAAGATSAPVTLTQAGKNTISLCFYDDYEAQSASVSIEVYAYEITLSWEGGNTSGEAANAVYRAVGDPMNLPTEGTRRGYDFAGWYNVPGGPKNGGAMVSGEATAANAIYYAYWTPKQYTVKLMLDLETVYAEETVSYRQYYQFATVEPEDPTMAFGGWYTAMNRKGTQLTNADGLSYAVWNTIPEEGEELKVYVGWLEAVDYVLSKDGKSYAATAGGAISKVSTIRITATRENPETGEILPVTEIKEEGFAAKSSLKVVYIPDTIQTLHLGADGPNEGKGFALRNCVNLEAVHVYCADEAEHEKHMADGIDGMFFSIDGVLFYENPNQEQKTELVLIPLAKTGSYEIPADVSGSDLQVTATETDAEGNEIVNTIDTIPTKVVSKTSLTEIIIPHTITKIDAFAFRMTSSANLETIVFKAAPEGVAEKPLAIGNGVFASQTKLTSITLPARIEALNLDPTDTTNFAFKGCSALAAVYISGTAENQIYKSTQDGVLTSMDDETIIFAPTAFAGVNGVYSTPVGIKTISAYAFYKNKNLTEVTIKSGVQTIGESAFDGCTAITKVDFQGEKTDAALSIATRAFYGCTALTYVRLPENLTNLAQYAFGGCTKLVKVDVYSVGAELTGFAAGAFLSTGDAGTSYVTEIWLSKETGVIELNGVFGSKLAIVNTEEGNEYYTTIDGVVFNKAETEIVYYPTEKDTEKYDIPATVTKIGAGVFKGKKYLQEVTIPTSVVEIGDEAFSGSSKLSKVTFAPNGTADLNLGNYVFYNCDSLTGIEFPTRMRKVGTHLFDGCAILESVVIPEGVTELGDAAFESTPKLKSVSLPSTLVKFGYAMVDGVETEVMMPFAYANQLETITVHKDNTAYRVIDGVLYGLNEAGEETILYYSPIMNGGDVVVPATVTKIWDKAFYNNARVTSITFAEKEADDTVVPDEGEEGGETEGEATAPAVPVFEIGANVFYGCIALHTVELPEGLYAIPKNTFYNCYELSAIIIPSTVTSIEAGAFYGCTNIATVTFEEGGTEPLVLGTQTGTSGGIFQEFKKLTTVVLPERTTVIGDYTFAKCYSLTNVNIPEGVTYIGEAAFQYTNLGDVVLPDGVTFVGGYAFQDAGLTSLYIGSELTMIGEGGSWGNQQTFADNRELTSVVFADDSKMTYFSGESFRGCTALTSIRLPATLETIKSNTFKDCRSLAEVVFLVDPTTQKSALKTIDGTVFQNTALTRFEFPESTSDISLGNYLFRGCTTLEEVYLSTSVTDLGKALDGCASIKRINIAQGHENFAQPDPNATLPFMYDATNKTIVKVFGEVKGTLDLSALSITGIGATAFAMQPGLTKVILPASLETIGDEAFASCWNLESVQFADTTADASLQTIGKKVFRYCEKLTSITIPESVTKIDQYAFANTSLTTVTIPASVTTMGTYVFSQCYDLASVNVQNKTIANYQFQECTALTTVNLNNVTSIGNYAFQKSGLTSVTIPATVTTVGTNLFVKCESLTSATVLGTTISNYMFRDCTALKTVSAPSAESIGNYAFDGCTELKSASVPSLKTIGTYAFQESGIVSIDASNVTTIGKYAFKLAANLRSITLSDSLKLIDEYMFQNCTSLTTINLGNVEQVKQYAFDGCTALSVIDLASIKNIGNYAFRGTGITSLTLPSTLTTVGTYMFANSAALTSIDVQGAKTGNYMFQNCTSLTSVEIPSHWTTVGLYLFDGCTGITSITFNNTTTSNYMFRGCTGLTSVTVPASVTTVGTNLFQNCTGLTSVTVDATKISNYMFAGCTGLTTVDISNATNLGTAGTYLFQNCTNLTSATIKSTATKLPNYMFDGCTSLVAVNYPNIKELGTYVFRGCTALESVTLGKVTTITTYTFENCTSLTSFDLTNVTKIDAYAFKNSGLTSVHIPAGLATIHANNPFYGVQVTAFTVDAGNTAYMAGPNGELCKADQTIISYPAGQSGVITIAAGYTVAPAAFVGCENITGINLPEGMTTIPQQAFALVTGLIKITIPASVEKIENSAFNGATNLREIVFAENSKLTEIGYQAFYNTGLVRVVLPDTVTRFGYNSATQQVPSGYVFYNSKALEYVKLPAHLTQIGNYNFNNCAALTTVILPTDLEVLGTNSFYGCESLASIELPASLATISDGAFRNSGIQTLVIPETVTTVGGTTSSASSTSSPVFDGSALREITFEGVPSVSIGKYLFYNATNLETVHFAEGWTEITDYMFQKATSLKNVVIPETVTFIGSYAFSETAITEMVIPDSVTALSYGYTFKDCASLEKVTLGAGITEIPYDMFSGCTSMESIYISEDRYVSNTAFRGWTEEQTIYVAASEYVAASWTTSNTNVAGWLKECNAKVVYNYVPSNNEQA